MPLSPITILEKLPAKSSPIDSPPHTPSQQPDLDLSLLDSSPPDGTELRKANALLNSAIKSAEGLASPVKRYTERMTQALEMTQSENVTLRKQVKEQQELLDMRKGQKRGKRVALKGKFVFSTEEVLRIVEEAEAETAAKKARKRPRQSLPEKASNEKEEEEIENLASDSDSDCIVVAMRR